MKTPIKYFIFILVLHTSFSNSTNIDKEPTKLQFNSNGEFKILQFTDLHYGEDAIKDDNSQMLQEKLIKEVRRCS